MLNVMDEEGLGPEDLASAENAFLRPSIGVL
jgi:hypothetical protein